MRRLGSILFGAAVLMGGCASIPSGLEWARDDADGEARLVLLSDGPLARPVTLSCLPASGAVDLTLVGYRRDGAAIELHSGKVWNRYRGAGVAEDGPDAPLRIQARLNAADPVLVHLADTGDLTIVQGQVKTTAPNAFAPAHDFLRLCQAG
ncbi:hypothetical protein [Phenylobacterium sp.]|uniref:hypothetical protein n=1 Tax=Phenylobacterium sp. TaxID=1871053 RepID=UPI0025D740A5|nr:hypothetical protein [Phenylobacterium sp.]